MKSKVISNKRNIFGIIKETVFGSMADFFKELGGTDEDEMQEEAVTPDGWQSLDGTLYVDRSGKPWMVFCHEWLQVGDGQMAITFNF